MTQISHLPLIRRHLDQLSNMKIEPPSAAVKGDQRFLGISAIPAATVHETTATPQYYGVSSNGDHEKDETCSLTSQESMARTSNDVDESNSGTNDTRVQVASYLVSSSLSEILVAVMEKHGDIAKDCVLESDYMQTVALEGICGVVQELQITQCTELKDHQMKRFYSIVKDVEKMKFNVKWLHQRLDEISLGIESIKDSKEQKDAKKKIIQRMESVNKTLELKKIEKVKLQSDIQELEGKLAMEKLAKEKLENTISDIEFRYKRFRKTCLMDGLF